MTKRKTVLSIIAVAVLLISVIAGTYAFFTANSNAMNSSNASITTGSLTLTLDDTSYEGLTSWAMSPNDLSRSVYLSITNDSPIDVYARLLFQGLTNTYSKYLVYSLEEVTSSGNSLSTPNVIKDKVRVPVSASASNQELANGLNITAGQTQYYKVTIEYLYSQTEDQSSDLSASFYTGFTIEEGSEGSLSLQTLKALNLTESSGTPNFASIAGTWSDVCLVNGEIVAQNVEDSSVCEEIYLIDYYNYRTDIETIEYIGSADFDSEGVCIYEGEIVESYGGCTAVYSINGGEEIFAVDSLEEISGTYNSSYMRGEVGIYSAEDDYGTSYYFRGNPINNYVKFGKNANNQDMWWRIIRINGDGSLRLLYDGTSAHTTGDGSSDRKIGNSKFNDKSDDAKYVGYMYGGAKGSASTSYAQAVLNETSSTIKGVLDNWYTQNIENTGYASYISDEIFCNDRSLSSGEGYAKNKTNYGIHNRLAVKTPTLICPQKNDAFTVSDTSKGNGALSKPIGLITADEIAYAGGKGGEENTGYYLNKGYHFWSLSPSSYSVYRACALRVNSGGLNDDDVDDYNAVVPVINLSTEYSQQLKGQGTALSPFVLN